ncbi:MAG: outer membrane protein assembly factor BamD (BamD/ComL family), partial [Alteromonas macleodii]
MYQMSRPLLLVIAILFLCGSASFAQLQVNKEVQRKRIYPVANKQLEAGKAQRATKNFLDLLAIDSTNALINYKVGRSYLLL